MLTEKSIKRLALRALIEHFVILSDCRSDGRALARAHAYMKVLELPETRLSSVDCVEALKEYASQQAAVYRATVAETELGLDDWMDVFVEYEHYYAYMHPARTPLTLLSDWIVEDGYCALRAIEGTDPEDVQNRVAFIEKTPRIRTKWTSDAIDHHTNWLQGPKGRGGNLEDEGETIYGFYPPSRAWCDAEMTKSGFIVPNITSFKEEKGKVTWSDVFDYLFDNEEEQA